MFDTSLPLMLLFFAGLGLLLTGLVNLTLRRVSARARAAGTLAACGLALGGAWACGVEPEGLGKVAAVLAAGVGACLLAGTRRVGAAAAAVVAAGHQPAARWGGLCAAGLVTLVGSVVYADLAFEQAVDREMADLEALTTKPATASPVGVRAATDRGTAIDVQEATAPRAEADLRYLEDHVIQSQEIRDSIIRTHPGDDRANCHGWVFTGGRYWITGAHVALILDENGYQPVTDPKPGDLAVYQSSGAINHTGVVRYVTAGHPVLVEGKWGCTGVFLHPADKSVYGAEFTYYRSARPGHVLAGLTAPDRPAVGPGGPTLAAAQTE